MLGRKAEVSLGELEPARARPRRPRTPGLCGLGATRTKQPLAFNKNKVMEVARRYTDKGQLDKAIKEYLRVVDDDPQDVRVWLKIGDLYVKKGAKREATETYLRVAEFYSGQGFFLKAVAVYKQILKLNPRLVEVNLKLAELYRQLGLMSDSMQHFEMVAGHFHREGKTKEALATVRQLVELAPDNVATRIKLAELYSKEGMIEEAVAEFGTACEYLRAQEREEDFVKVGERLLWHKADNVTLSRELARIYLRRNDARRALQKLQACFKTNPRDVETLELLAQAFQHLEQSAKTVSVLKEMARVLEEDGKRDRVSDVYQRILRLAPGDRDALAHVGQIASGSGAGAAPPVPSRQPAPPPVPARTRPLTVSMPAPPEPRISQPTGSVPLIAPPPGSVPLVDERSHASVIRETAAARSNARPVASDFAEDPAFESSAAGEAHSEVIAKILTETDVYVKYGLKDKAIEHLRRVFTLDPVNVEARERLKDLLIAQGRRDEALAELMQLAELSASYNRDRAGGYLRQLLSFQPGYPPALELARRSGIPIDGVRTVAAAETTRPGLAATLEDALESALEGVPEESMDFADIDIEFEESMQSAGDTRVITPRNSLLRPRGGSAETGAADSVETAVLSLEDVEIDGSETLMGVDADVALDPDGFASSIDTALGGSTELIDLDEAEEALFGAEPISDILESFTSSIEGEGVPTRVMHAFDLDDEFSIDMEELESSTAMEVAGDMAHVAQQHQNPGQQAPSPRPGSQPGIGGKGAGGIDDDLDEADFFVAQGLYDSAREILQHVLATHPSHPLILAKLEEIDEIERNSGGAAAPPRQTSSPDDSTLDRSSRKQQQQQRKPSVMLQRPVEDEDADTHYDLGLAYKEMGLYEEAIQEFEKVLTTPKREVQCRLMMGLCYREQGDALSAINQFKAGLHAPSISPSEQLSLYYEIATSYETGVGDPHEALYFYELIQKRERDYRDLQVRLAACREQLSRKDAPARDGRREIGRDVDDAVDSLLAEADSHGRRGR
jgi:pilus assembly protein FimV